MPRQENAVFSWSIDAAGTIAPKGAGFVWTAAAGTGITAPNSWQKLDKPKLENLAGLTANEALAKQTWNSKND